METKGSAEKIQRPVNEGVPQNITQRLIGYRRIEKHLIRLRNLQ